MGCLESESASSSIFDPFAGSGTTIQSAKISNRNSIGIELIPEYIPLIRKKVKNVKIIESKSIIERSA